MASVCELMRVSGLSCVATPLILGIMFSPGSVPGGGGSSGGWRAQGQGSVRSGLWKSKVTQVWSGCVWCGGLFCCGCSVHAPAASTFFSEMLFNPVTSQQILPLFYFIFLRNSILTASPRAPLQQFMLYNTGSCVI